MMNNASGIESRKIRAAVLNKPGAPLKIESLDMEGPRDDEILVRIVATGICRTDIEMCEFWDEASRPVVLGHEGAGIVERVGCKVKEVREGDHVVLSFQSCGRCRQCKRGHPAGCSRFYDANFGFRRLDGSNALKKSGVGGHFFGQSSFATYSLATKRNCVKVPQELPLPVLAPLGCGLQTGAGTIFNSLKVSAGTSVAVFGAGTVGLAAVMAARIAGAEPIIAVDINPMRLALALELGATHSIDNRHEYIISRVYSITGSGVDCVLEITGDPIMFQIGVDVLNPNGVIAGFSGEDIPASLTRDRRALNIIQGDSAPQQFIPELISYFQGGTFPFDRLITFYDFTDINRAMADARRGDTIKPVLLVSELNPQRETRNAKQGNRCCSSAN